MKCITDMLISIANDADVNPVFTNSIFINQFTRNELISQNPINQISRIFSIYPFTNVELTATEYLSILDVACH